MCVLKRHRYAFPVNLRARSRTGLEDQDATLTAMPRSTHGQTFVQDRSVNASAETGRAMT